MPDFLKCWGHGCLQRVLCERFTVEPDRWQSYAEPRLHDGACLDFMPNKIFKLIDAASLVSRGCACDYDYRCTSCQRVLNIATSASELQQSFPNSPWSK